MKTDTEAELGYGKPSKGKYSLKAFSGKGDQGYKTFGTVGQGASSYGTREDSSSSAKCKERYMLVSATNKSFDRSKDNKDKETQEVEVELGSYEFVEDLNSSTVNQASLVNSEEGAGALAVKMLAAVSMMVASSAW